VKCGLAECQLLYNVSQLFCGFFQVYIRPSLVRPLSLQRLSNVVRSASWFHVSGMQQALAVDTDFVIGVDASAEVNNYNVSYLLIKTVT